MAKRFIDTGLFEDPWFADLNMSGKILWVYFLTRCDSAGLMKYNKKLIEFQTGIKGIETVVQELGKRLLRVNQELIFCPKFIEFQYPGFPKSNAPQQKGACDLLIKAGLMNPDFTYSNSYLTLTQDLPKSYGNSNEEGKGNGNEEIQVTKFQKTLAEFYQMRVRIKKPATERAKELILLQLNKLAGSDEAKKISILEQSIRNSWQDVYALKPAAQQPDREKEYNPFT